MDAKRRELASVGPSEAEPSEAGPRKDGPSEAGRIVAVIYIRLAIAKVSIAAKVRK